MVAPILLLALLVVPAVTNGAGIGHARVSGSGSGHCRESRWAWARFLMLPGLYVADRVVPRPHAKVSCVRDQGGPAACDAHKLPRPRQVFARRKRIRTPRAFLDGHVLSIQRAAPAAIFPPYRVAFGRRHCSLSFIPMQRQADQVAIHVAVDGVLSDRHVTRQVALNRKGHEIEVEVRRKGGRVNAWRSSLVRNALRWMMQGR